MQSRRLSRQTWVLVALAAFCVASLLIKENYPFSNYPMYSDPDSYAHVYFLADAEEKPLPMYDLTFVTSPNLGKILRRRQQDRAKKLNISFKKLPEAENQVIGKDMVSYLRAQSKYLGTEAQMPPVLKIMRITLEFENGKVVERPEVIYSES
jgi:hypothetical protein